MLASIATTDLENTLRGKFIAERIFSLLLDYYDFHDPFYLSEFWISKDSLEFLEQSSSRGEVLILSDTDEEIAIGIYLETSIFMKLSTLDPFLKLEEKNLDAFCVMVEEISHFLLLTERVKKNQPLSKLELEWQAETDKILLASMLLRFQTGYSHLQPLVQKNFDQCILDTSNPEYKLYSEANRLAGKFWFALLRAGIGGTIPIESKHCRKLMKDNYHRPLSTKLVTSQKRVSC